MNELMVASYGLLWLIVLALIAIVVALTRQIGILHTRLAPAGALMTSDLSDLQNARAGGQIAGQE